MLWRSMFLWCCNTIIIMLCYNILIKVSFILPYYSVVLLLYDVLWCYVMMILLLYFVMMLLRFDFTLR